MEERFQAGDRRVLAVEPVPGAPSPPERPWVCANCGTERSGVGQCLLHYGAPSASRREVFVVCPDCAYVLNPVRLHLDLASFERVVHERPVLRTVVALATSVVADRGVEDRHVRLRASDTVAVADDLGMTPSELVAELYAVGALVG